MRNHIGCTGFIELGELGEVTQGRLEQVKAVWLEFSPQPASLVVRHVQPDDIPPLREIAGELLEFLGEIPEEERARIPGGTFYFLDEQSGQYVRLKVWKGGFLTVAWARPDYSHARWEPYQGQKVPLVFEAYQRLNGTLKLLSRASAAEEIRAAVERFGGLGPPGEFEANASEGRVEIRLRDVNTSALPLLKVLRATADPPSSLEGELDVSSFRAGDLEDYCRFVFRAGEVWLVRPSLWNDLPQTEAAPSRRMESAA